MAPADLPSGRPVYQYHNGSSISSGNRQINDPAGSTCLKNLRILALLCRCQCQFDCRGFLGSVLSVADLTHVGLFTQIVVLAAKSDMWLLHTENLRLSFLQGSDVPTYAILSHRWQEDEVSFDDVCGDRHAYKELKGWQKILGYCEVASEAGLEYVWTDTCCIDKRSSAELSEAINSMYNWYRSATVCYAYLSDVRSVEDMDSSLWFLRSWTLQELLAPRTVVFFNADWIMMGDKTSLQPLLSTITSTPATALQDFRVENHSVAQKMSWAANSVATRIEDVAYSLLGLFDINLPLLYGEGDKAF